MRDMDMTFNARDFTGTFNMYVNNNLEPIYAGISTTPVSYTRGLRTYNLMASTFYGLRTFLAYTGEKVEFYHTSPLTGMMHRSILRMGRDGEIYEELNPRRYRRFDAMGVMSHNLENIEAPIIEVSISDLWFMRTGFEHLTDFNVN